MLEPRHKGNKYWYPLLNHPLARVMKFERLMTYFGQLPAGASVLDYGSGDRPYENLLREKFSNYIAADYDVTNRQHSRRPDIYIDGDRLDLPDNSVDCVLFTEVLEHLYEPGKVLQEIHRILKPGGHIIGTVPFAVQEHEQPYDFHRYTYFCLQRMFPDAGYTIVKLEYIGDMIAVTISTTSRILSLFTKLLSKYHLGFIAWIFNLFVKIPEFIYHAISKTALNPQKLAYLKSFPLGFTFMLEKAATEPDFSE